MKEPQRSVLVLSPDTTPLILCALAECGDLIRRRQEYVYTVNVCPDPRPVDAVFAAIHLGIGHSDGTERGSDPPIFSTVNHTATLIQLPRCGVQTQYGGKSLPCSCSPASAC